MNIRQFWQIFNLHLDGFGKIKINKTPNFLLLSQRLKGGHFPTNNRYLKTNAMVARD